MRDRAEAAVICVPPGQYESCHATGRLRWLKVLFCVADQMMQAELFRKPQCSHRRAE